MGLLPVAQQVPLGERLRGDVPSKGQPNWPTRYRRAEISTCPIAAIRHHPRYYRAPTIPGPTSRPISALSLTLGHATFVCCCPHQAAHSTCNAAGSLPHAAHDAHSCCQLASSHASASFHRASRLVSDGALARLPARASTLLSPVIVSAKPRV